MQTGRERLAVWIERSHLTQRAAAQLLGFHYTFLSQIIRGNRSPGLVNAVQIERVTGIAVDAWLPTAVDGVTSQSAARREKTNDGKV